MRCIISTAMQSLSLNEAKRQYYRCGLDISESVGDMSTVFWSTVADPAMASLAGEARVKRRPPHIIMQIAA